MTPNTDSVAMLRELLDEYPAPNFTAERAALTAAIAALEAQASALAYATRLAAAMHRDHYAEDAPQWEPFPDLMGVLSQIGNMLTGLARKQASAPGGEVMEEMVAAALDAQPFKDANSGTRVWQLIASDGEGTETVMRAALIAALAARAGKGE